MGWELCLWWWRSWTQRNQSHGFTNEIDVFKFIWYLHLVWERFPSPLSYLFVFNLSDFFSNLLKTCIWWRVRTHTLSFPTFLTHTCTEVQWSIQHNQLYRYTSEIDVFKCNKIIWRTNTFGTNTFVQVHFKTDELLQNSSVRRRTDGTYNLSCVEVILIHP